MNGDGGARRRQRVLEFLAEYSAEHGYQPTVREIAAGVGLRSTSTVSHHLRALELAGKLRRGTGARMITIIDPGKPTP